jgi:pimeloyl-ACP methyl ester carboxylesterase
MIVWIAGIAIGLILLITLGLVLFTAWTGRQVEKKVPPRGHFIDLDGVRLHYLDEGTGPELLFIHGLAGQMRNFTHSLLGRLKGDFRVIILDRPGSGYSMPPNEALAPLTTQARIISRFCQVLGLERPLVVGHSLGGAIALALALNHPEQVAGLALIAPVTHQPGRVPPPFDALAIQSPLLRVVAWTLATPLSIANSERALTTLFGPQPIAPDFATKGGGLLNLRPAAFIGASSDLMAAEHELAFVVKVPGAELELIEGGGHMILISSADQTAAFISRIARRAAATDAPRAPVR